MKRILFILKKGSLNFYDYKLNIYNCNQVVKKRFFRHESRVVLGLFKLKIFEIDFWDSKTQKGQKCSGSLQGGLQRPPIWFDYVCTKRLLSVISISNIMRFRSKNFGFYFLGFCKN